jgi:transcriptional regulator GlxA family with amidase domain
VIENNIEDTISLQRLAQMTGRSISSFRRDFQSHYKMPPSRWIRRRKLEKAKELLTATNMTVTHICYTLGFESIAHFSRLFKSYFGYPPSGSRMQKTTCLY